ncbi:hypothetical protein FKW77_010258 [Venturia effusa]|uniref:Uncharacterized protein n=1 Tax=Venturia effusa TaxID=50376 RepID=A0A517L6C8_9PEZI|nr:hypothetical protein FKW77_010258 [Venturia effusa]
MSTQTPSRLPRFGSSKLPTPSSGKKDEDPVSPMMRSDTRLSAKKRTVAALRNPETAHGSSFLSRFQKKAPPTPPKPDTQLTRSFSVATHASPLSEKPLPSPPVAQVVHQETGRTLLDASEVPVPLRPLSPKRPGASHIQGFTDIPQPPATTPDRTLQKRPSYHELKRKASEFIGLKVSAEQNAPPMPRTPAGCLSTNTMSVAVEPSTPTPATVATGNSTAINGSYKFTEPNLDACAPMTSHSRLTEPTTVSNSRKRRSSSSSPLIANPGSFKSTNSKVKGSGLGRPNGPPRSAGLVPPRAALRNVSSSTAVGEEAPAALPRPSPSRLPTSANLSVQNGRSFSGRSRIPAVPIKTPYSVADSMNADKAYAPARAAASGLQSVGVDVKASPTAIKSSISNEPATKAVTPVAANVILPAPPLPFASPRHSARASQASQKSHAAKVRAGASSTTVPGSSRAVFGSHEDTLPKNPSPLRDALAWDADSDLGNNDLGVGPVKDTLKDVGTIQPKTIRPSTAAPTLGQLMQAAIYSMPVEERPAFMQLMTRRENAVVECAEKEKLARQAEMEARAKKMDAEVAQMLYARLHREVQEIVVIHTT